MSNLYKIRYYEKNEQAKKKQKLEEFKCPNKKKFSHALVSQNLPDSTQDNCCYTVTEMLEPGNMQRVMIDQDESKSDSDSSPREKNKEKTITWRSPLVYSPAMKFSPKINFKSNKISRNRNEEDSENKFNNETFSMPVSSKSNNNLTSNVKSTDKREITMSIRYENKPRGTGFPLRDKDYRENSNNDQQEDTFDICSSSFLEQMGLPNNQNKFTFKSKKTFPSPTVNYYSQLLSEPIQAQKQKTFSTPQSNKSNRDESKENLSDTTDLLNKSVPPIIPSQQVRKPEVSQGKQNLSHSFCPEEQSLQDTTQYDIPVSRDHVVAQSRPGTYHTISYNPQVNLNSTIPNQSFLQVPVQHYVARDPNVYSGKNYDCRPVPYNSVHGFANCDTHELTPQFVRGNHAPVSSIKPYVNNEHCFPHPCHDYPKPPQIYPFIDTSNYYRNTAHMSTHVDRKLPYPEENTPLQTRFFYESCPFHQQRHYSQYFQRNQNDSSDRPVIRVKEERDVSENNAIVYNSESRLQKYPQMLSLQDLNQQKIISQQNPNDSVPLQNSFVKRKSFEEKMNQANNLRNSETSFGSTIFRRENVSNDPVYIAGELPCNVRNNPQFVPYPENDMPWVYKRQIGNTEFGRRDSNERNINNVTQNQEVCDNITKILNRSLSFEEKRNFIEENPNVVQNTRSFGYGVQRNDANHSVARNNSGYPHNFDDSYRYVGAAPNVDRPYAPPNRMQYPGWNYYEPPNRGEMDTFHPTDKEYVMDKFLYSLNGRN